MSQFEELLAGVNNLNSIIQSTIDRRVDMTRRIASIQINKMNQDFIMRTNDPTAQNRITIDNWKDELKKHNMAVDQYIDQVDFAPARQYIRTDVLGAENTLQQSLVQSMVSQMHDKATSDALLARQMTLDAGDDPDTTFQKLNALSDEYERAGMFAPKTITDWRLQDMSNHRTSTAMQSVLKASGGDYNKAQDMIMADPNLNLSAGERTDIARRYQAAYAIDSHKYLADLNKRIVAPEYQWTRQETLATIAEIDESTVLSDDDKLKAKTAVYKQGYLDFYNGWVGRIGLAQQSVPQLERLWRELDGPDEFWNSPSGEPDRATLRDAIENNIRALKEKPVGKPSDTEIKATVYQAFLNGVIRGVGDKEFMTTIVAPLILQGSTEADPRYSLYASEGMKELKGWRDSFGGGSGAYVKGLATIQEWAKGRSKNEKDGSSTLVLKLYEDYYKTHPKADDFDTVASTLMSKQSATTLADWTSKWDDGTFGYFGGADNYFARNEDANGNQKKAYEAAIASSKASFMETMGFTEDDEKSGRFFATVVNGEPVYTVRDKRGTTTEYDPQMVGGKLGFQARGSQGAPGKWTTALTPGTTKKQKDAADLAAGIEKTKSVLAAAEGGPLKAETLQLLKNAMGDPETFVRGAEAAIARQEITEADVLTLGDNPAVAAFKKKRKIP